MIATNYKSLTKCTVSTLLIFLIVLPSLAFVLPEDDQVITGIPGYTHRIYSGYLDITLSQKAKSVHYVYFQSQKDIAKDPVIIWLSGGPGCSSLMAMLQENGPLIITPGTERAALNPNAWNKRAGLVYIEAPAGTGFSESLSDDTITDETVATELIDSLGLFLDRHRNLKKNDLYISGSGYGAIFASHLASKIIERNKDESLIFWDKINLKGILLGNPCVNPDQCFASGSQRNSIYHYEFLYNRGFIYKKMYMDYMGKCSIIIDPYSCYVARQNIDKFINATNSSAYNIYGKCYNTSRPNSSSSSQQNTINLGCEDESGATNYLNDQHFKQNWNIRPQAKWTPCNIKIWNEYHSGNGSLHLIEQLIRDGLRVWVYSGDMDSTVPITGTKAWVNYYRSVHQVPIKKNWRQWWIPGKHKGEDQVGGFIWELEGLTVVAVKAAGFKASYDQPISMEEVLNGFLDGKTLPFKA